MVVDGGGSRARGTWETAQTDLGVSRAGANDKGPTVRIRTQLASSRSCNLHWSRRRSRRSPRVQTTRTQAVRHPMRGYRPPQADGYRLPQLEQWPRIWGRRAWRCVQQGSVASHVRFCGRHEAVIRHPRHLRCRNPRGGPKAS
eukprot:scaffold196776_cov32-Tisochrysis_lutea.AAC.2